MSPPYPKRVALAHTPTPLQHLSRLSQRTGFELYVKRDDLTGCGLSGNKVRKLEFVLAEALGQSADHVITCGKVQSNHARATALAAGRLGLKCSLVLRCQDPKHPPRPAGNHLLDVLAGAHIHWIDYAQWPDREAIMAEIARTINDSGGKCYQIPFGASNALGAWGEIRAMEELRGDLSGLPGGLEVPVSLVTAAGSGGALAGYSLGARLFGIPAKVLGINVDDYDFIVNTVGKVHREAAEKYGLTQTPVRGRDYDLIDGYLGEGYALSTPEEIEFIYEIARLEGLVLDPVYTGKALRGLLKELKNNPAAFARRIVFMHTGGIFHLFTEMPGLDRADPSVLS